MLPGLELGAGDSLQSVYCLGMAWAWEIGFIDGTSASIITFTRICNIIGRNLYYLSILKINVHMNWVYSAARIK